MFSTRGVSCFAIAIVTECLVGTRDNCTLMYRCGMFSMYTADFVKYSLFIAFFIVIQMPSQHRCCGYAGTDDRLLPLPLASISNPSLPSSSCALLVASRWYSALLITSMPFAAHLVAHTSALWLKGNTAIVAASSIVVRPHRSRYQHFSPLILMLRFLLLSSLVSSVATRSLRCNRPSFPPSVTPDIVDSSVR